MSSRNPVGPVLLSRARLDSTQFDTHGQERKRKNTQSIAEATSETDEGWSFHPNHRKGKPTLVTPRIHVGSIVAIDTAKCTAEVVILVWLHWADERLIGWNRSGRRPLPNSLWTPRLRIAEACSEAGFGVSMTELYLHDESNGGMYSLTRYEGMVTNPMDNLRTFPMDHDRITFTFFSCETYSRDGQVNVNFKEDYRMLVKGILYEVGVKTPFIATEWELEGTVVSYVKPDHCQDALQVTLYVSRNSSYYLYKMLVPLFLTIVMGQVAFVFPPTDLENKANLNATLLLSTFALIYVLSQDLPKTSFLTLIDKIVLATMASIVFMGLLSGAMYKLHEYGLEDLSHQLNSVGLFFCPVAYVLLCVGFLVPAWHKRRLELKSLFNTARAATGREERPWKFFVTLKKTNEVLKDNPQLLEGVMHDANEMLRSDMSGEEEQMMLKSAEQKGILRIDIGGVSNGHALAWEELEEIANKLGGSLPTKGDLCSAGVNAGKNNLWMPVKREDGITRDWCQIGDHSGRRGQRYISYRDEYEPTHDLAWHDNNEPNPLITDQDDYDPTWHASSYPMTCRPAAYFYGMFSTPQGLTAAKQRMHEQRNEIPEPSGGGHTAYEASSDADSNGSSSDDASWHPCRPTKRSA